MTKPKKTTKPKPPVLETVPKRKLVTDEVWTMKDGSRVMVGDMTESHVRNTLRMILRKQRLGPATRSITGRLSGDPSYDVLGEFQD